MLQGRAWRVLACPLLAVCCLAGGWVTAAIKVAHVSYPAPSPAYLLHPSSLYPLQADPKIPPLKFIEKHVKPVHPPINGMLKENYAALAQGRAEAKEKEWKGLKDDSIIPRAYRPF